MGKKFPTRNVAVIGLGEVGLATAVYIKEKGLDVTGYDIKRGGLARAAKAGVQTSKTFPVAGIYVVCVNTLYKKKAKLTPVEEVLARIAKVRPSSLVSVEDTMPPGATREIAERNHLKNVVLVPQRYWKEHPDSYGVNQPRVIGALNQTSLKKGLKFFERLEIPLYVCPTLETAELAKLVENTHRYVQIAYAEEIKRICDDLGERYYELKKAVDTKWNVRLLEPRKGVGRSCLSRDMRYLLGSVDVDAPLIEGAMQSDMRYREHIRKRLAYLYGLSV